MRAVFLLAIASFAALGAAQDYGLMLGLSSREDGLKTVFVHKKGVATFAKETGEGCWLWTKDGFIHVATDGLIDGGARSIIVTNQTGEKSVISAGEGRPETFYEVAYVSAFGLGFTSSMERAQPVGAGFGGFPKRYPTVFRNRQWSDLSAPVEIGQAFDAQVASEFERIATERGKSNRALEEEASPTNWVLYHSQGEWQIYGRVLPKLTMEQADGVMFLVGPAKDKKFGVTDLGPKWTRVRTEYPDVVDMTTSPNGKLTVVVTPDTVFIHESSGSTLGRKLQQVRTSSRQIVMTQWLEASEVGKAADALNKRN